MQRLLLVLLITTGAISLSGCGFFNRNGNEAVEEPTTPTEPVTQSVEPVEGELPGLPAGEDPGAVAISTNSPTVVPRDLIQSTDPNERAIGVERTRPDPFAGLTIPLVPPQPIEVPGTAAAPAVTQSPGQSSPGGSGAAAVGSGRAPGAAGAGQGASFQENPGLEVPRQLESDRPEIASLPEIPQPTTARAVRVSGVMQIGGSPYAIVQAPDEIERYVRQGERIAGGRVIVKRIEARSAEPRVILVENGIEVERLVTSDGEVAEEAPQPVSAPVSTIGALPQLPRPGI